MQIATVFACVRVLAESVGMLPINVIQQQGDRTQRVTDSPLAKALKSGPNDYMTAQEYKELVTTHLCLRGNHYAFINEFKGASTSYLELLPMDPAAVEPKIDANYQVSYEVTFANGRKETLPANKVFHVRLFSLDGLNGLSPIQWARNAMGLAKATERHGSKLFKNAAQPSGGFKTDKALKEEQVKNLKDQLQEYAGDGAYRNLILQGGLEWFQTTMTSEDAQFLETRKFQRGEICGIFRVPPHMIADLERATFSNIEHQGLSFVQHSLMPYLSRIEHRINKSLISESGQYAKFNANALLRGDMKARAEFYTKMLQNGALSPNEIRGLEDMDPREGGDIYLTPMNMAVDGKPADEEQDDNEEETDVGTSEETT
jgi:HK97 family phage portal protein